MKAPDDLTVAKQIVADQQITISRLLGQIRSTFAFNPDGLIVHVTCGSPLVIIEGEISTSCECFD